MEFTSARLFLGETTGAGITAIATICMVLVMRVKDKAYTFIKRRFPSMRETAFGYNPISRLHYTTLPR